jgi:hypothetical protein
MTAVTCAGTTAAGTHPGGGPSTTNGYDRAGFRWDYQRPPSGQRPTIT